MGGGAWPFLVGGVICLVNSVNERDLSLLTSDAHLLMGSPLLRGTIRVQRLEVGGNNRSVMPFDVLGRTRATLMDATSSTLDRKARVNLSKSIVMGIDYCNS